MHRIKATTGIAIVLLCLLTGMTTAAPVTQSITYQGKLTDATGSPLTGTYAVKFSLYGAATGGTALASSSQAVTCANGLFTAPLSFSPEYFRGGALWLGIRVGSDPEMTPRQEIRPVPYALSLRPGAWITATGDTSVLTLEKDGNGNALYVYTTGTSGPAIASETFADTATAFSAETHGKNAGAIQGTTVGESSTAVNLITWGKFSPGILASTRGDNSNGIRVATEGVDSDGIYIRTIGDTSPGMMVSTTGTASAGVVAYTEKDLSVGVLSSTGGNNADALSASTDGDSSQGLDARTLGTGSSGVSAQAWGDNSDGVYGTSAKAAGIHGKGVWGGLFSTNQPGYGSFIPNGIGVQAEYHNNRGIAVRTSGKNSVGVLAETTDVNSDAVYAVTANSSSTALYGLAAGAESNAVVAYSAQWTAIYAGTGRSDDEYALFTPDKISAMAYDTSAHDVAEFMPVTGDAPPGTVLVIGEAGILEPASGPYDTRVAGIVSTEPGMSLGKRDDGNAGEAIVAVAGRVPCRADAGFGAIRAGDLLTTSPTRGHAMKAVQPPPGTILGKAMGSLESGTGTIEVLVTLQ